MCRLVCALLFVAVFLGCTSTGRVGLCFFVVLFPGTPEGSTGSGSGFKASQKTGQRLKVSSDRLGRAGNRTCDPWFTRHRFIPYTTAASQLVCAFVVRKTPQDSFLTSSPILCFLNIKKLSTQVLMYSIQNTRIVEKHVSGNYGVNFDLVL